MEMERVSDPFTIVVLLPDFVTVMARCETLHVAVVPEESIWQLAPPIEEVVITALTPRFLESFVEAYTAVSEPNARITRPAHMISRAVFKVLAS